MSPFLTIGIASYNYARFLPRAFEAIRRQKFQDYEILYCDDGSTDASVSVIRGFINRYPNIQIRLVEAENRGVMANKNRIIENAHGKYIMFCDADDWMDDGCLQLLADKARETNADRVIAGFRHVINRNGVLYYGQEESLPVNPSKWNQFQHHGCLYKRSVCIENNVFFRENHYPDDFDFVERFNIYCKDVAYVYSTVYNFYFDGRSTSSTSDHKSRWYYLNLFKDILELTSEILPRLEVGDYWELQATVMRIYFANLRSSVYSWSEYKRQKQMLAYYMPDYAQNPLLHNVKKFPSRKDAAKAARTLLRLDQLHLIYPVICLYHKAEKIKFVQSK